MKEKILIIEDDPLIRNELKTLLQSNGYKTVAPEDFSDVIDQIRKILRGHRFIAVALQQRFQFIPYQRIIFYYQYFFFHISLREKNIIL